MQASVDFRGVFSLRWFRVWIYEVSNQGVSFMQGVEIAERLVTGYSKITVSEPNHVNAKNRPFWYELWQAFKITANHTAGASFV